jgi:hypothetical protein
MPPDPVQQLLMNACITHDVTFRWGMGMILIPLRDIAVLTELPDDPRVLAIESFTIHGYGIQPDSWYLRKFIEQPLTMAEALTELASFPQDLELWINPIIVTPADLEELSRLTAEANVEQRWAPHARHSSEG